MVDELLLWILKARFCMSVRSNDLVYNRAYLDLSQMFDQLIEYRVLKVADNGSYRLFEDSAWTHRSTGFSLSTIIIMSIMIAFMYTVLSRSTLAKFPAR